MFFFNGSKIGEYTGTAMAEVIKLMKQYKDETAKQAATNGSTRASGSGSPVGLLIKGLALAGVGAFAYLAHKGKLPPAVTEALQNLKDSLFATAETYKAKIAAATAHIGSSGESEDERPPWEEGDDGLTLTLTQVSWNDGEQGATGNATDATEDSDSTPEPYVPPLEAEVAPKKVKTTY